MPGVSCPISTCSYVTPDDATTDLAITLLKIHATEHDSTSTPTTTKTEKIRRPTVSTGGTSEEWAYFLSRWNDYKMATGISGSVAVIQLLECCDEALRKDLTRANGGTTLTGKSETDVTEAIHKLAVRNENLMVDRVQLHNLRQDRDEPVRSYAARLRGQASVCKFSVECPSCSSTVDYSEHVLRDAITRGISDSEIQMELLGEQNQNMSLEEIISYIEAKEAGKRSASHLLNTQVISTSAVSNYKKEQSKRPLTSSRTPCNYCGHKENHGHRRKDREKTCPAFRHTCGKCGIRGHFDAVCRGGNRNKQMKDSEDAIFDALCGISESGFTCNIATHGQGAYHTRSSYLQ